MRKHGLWLGCVCGLVSCQTAPPVDEPFELMAIAPSMGPTSGGVSVRLVGTGFTPQTVVSFDGIPSPMTSVESTKLLISTLPAHLGRIGLVDVRVQDGAQQSAILPKAFRYFYGVTGFTAHPDQPATGVNPWFLAADDVNGDKVIDLIVTNYTSADVNVLLGMGNGSFRPQVTYSAGRSPFGFTVADVDGDGKKDLVIGQYASDPVQVLFGKGDGTFEAGQAVPTGAAPRGVAVSDMNGV